MLPVLYGVHFGLHAVPYAVVADGVCSDRDAQLVGFAGDGADSSEFSSVCVTLSPSVRP